MTTVSDDKTQIYRGNVGISPIPETLRSGDQTVDDVQATKLIYLQPLPARARLEILLGKRAGVVVDIIKLPFYIGRDAKNNLVLPDETISSQHAKLVKENEFIWLEDLGSRNGVWVDGKKTNRHQLAPQDFFRLGDVEFQFFAKVDLANRQTVEGEETTRKQRIIKHNILKTTQPRYRVVSMICLIAVTYISWLVYTFDKHHRPFGSWLSRPIPLKPANLQNLTLTAKAASAILPTSEQQTQLPPNTIDPKPIGDQNQQIQYPPKTIVTTVIADQQQKQTVKNKQTAQPKLATTSSEKLSFVTPEKQIGQPAQTDQEPVSSAPVISLAQIKQLLVQKLFLQASSQYQFCQECPVNQQIHLQALASEKNDLPTILQKIRAVKALTERGMLTTAHIAEQNQLLIQQGQTLLLQMLKLGNANQVKQLLDRLLAEGLAITSDMEIWQELHKQADALYQKGYMIERINPKEAAQYYKQAMAILPLGDPLLAIIEQRLPSSIQ